MAIAEAYLVMGDRIPPGSNLGGRGVKVERNPKDEMEAFDQLPPMFRHMLRCCVSKYAPSDILKALRHAKRLGVDPMVLMADIAECDVAQWPEDLPVEPAYPRPIAPRAGWPRGRRGVRSRVLAGGGPRG